jgi:nucleoside-diphosphate-sugar epimerase
VKKILVTGAGGYIGSTLTRMLLEADYRVVALDRFFFGRQTLPDEGNNLEIVQADIRWLDESVFKDVDVVIDLAAISNDPSGELHQEKTWEINHQGRARNARLAKKMGVDRYILPSSCSTYGFQKGILNEESSLNPLTTYAKANLKAEQDILPLADNDFTAVVIRQATVYGLSYRMRFDIAINGMVKGFYQNGKIPILRDGTQWRPFVHVKDTSRAMMLLLEAESDLVNGEIFNVGSDDQNVQIMPLAKMVAEACELPFEYEWYGDPDVRSYRVSFQKIADKLGYETLYSPKDGAREVFDAIRDDKVDPDDPRWITVKWYKQIMDMHDFLNEIELDGVLL